MTTLECGCRIMEDRIKMKQNITDDKGNLSNIVLYPDHIYKHFINVCGKCCRKASIFNRGEDIKLKIAQKQFNVLKGEDASPEARVLRVDDEE